MSIRVLEHVVRRAGLAVRLTDLATGLPVREGIVVSTWPAARPDLRASTGAVTGAGVAGFTQLPGLRTYEDGSTPRGDWFASPLHFPPVPFVVRIDDTTGAHLTVVREVFVPVAAPVDIALPRAPSTPVPSGSLMVVGNAVTQSGAPASWAVVEVSVGGLVTGGVADARGVVVIPVPRAAPASSIGTPTGGPTWQITVRVRYRPADQAAAAGAVPGDPPTLTSLLTQQPALIDDGGALVASVQRTLTSAGPLVLASRPSPAPSTLVVRPAP